MAKLKSIFTFI